MVADKSAASFWFASKSGAKFLSEEQKELSPVIAKAFGFYMLSVGNINYSNIQKACKTQVLISATRDSYSCIQQPKLNFDGLRLPFLSHSVDVIVLCHALEDSENPHALLREVHRVLRHDGAVVIAGINPFSFWGIGFFLHKLRHFIFKTSMLPVSRVCDWLRLLDFDIEEQKHYAFRPAWFSSLNTKPWPRTKKFFQRFWPSLAGGYIISAKKCTLPLSLATTKWDLEKPVWSGTIAKPTTRA